MTVQALKFIVPDKIMDYGSAWVAYWDDTKFANRFALVYNVKS